MSGFQSIEAVRTRLRQLSAQREALEIEADAIASELTSVGPNGEAPAGVKGPLVDSEGYPRSDVDLYNVRGKRNRLATINYDHKALMKEIEKDLALLHSFSNNVGEGASESSTPSATAATTVTMTSTVTHSSLPFAVIDEILVGSPAEQAGLQNYDELIAFGTIRFETVDNLNCIPALLRDNVNKPIPIEVRRRNTDSVLRLVLQPQPWSGRGLLGCHLTPTKR
jgi:26S proteasome non-ATPase regulatory subunit 9